MVYAAQQACLAEYNRYQAHYYRVYSVPTYRSYSPRIRFRTPVESKMLPDTRATPRTGGGKR